MTDNKIVEKVSVPRNILSKFTKEDPELILQTELIKKYGERYRKYRKNYNTMLNDDEHKSFFDYPLTVVLELVNRCNCTRKAINLFPAAIHIDNTARLQIINKTINSKIYKLLSEYFKISKIPTLINTSFNVHENPLFVV